MLIGAVFGMITAVTLGVNNLLTAVVARRFGVLRSTTITLTIAFVVMIAWALVIGVPLRDHEGPDHPAGPAGRGRRHLLPGKLHGPAARSGLGGESRSARCRAR